MHAAFESGGGKFHFSAFPHGHVMTCTGARQAPGPQGHQCLDLAQGRGRQRENRQQALAAADLLRMATCCSSCAWSSELDWLWQSQSAESISPARFTPSSWQSAGFRSDPRGAALLRGGVFTKSPDTPVIAQILSGSVPFRKAPEEAGQTRADRRGGSRCPVVVYRTPSL